MREDETRELEDRAAAAFVALVELFRKYDRSMKASALDLGRMTVRAARAAGFPPGVDMEWVERAMKDLTPTEFEVMRRIGMGMTNREIAGSMYISPLTVRTHAKRVHEKLDIKGRAVLAVVANRLLFAKAGDSRRG